MKEFGDEVYLPDGEYEEVSHTHTIKIGGKNVVFNEGYPKIYRRIS